MIGRPFTPESWPANVKILFTSRGSGVSAPPFDTLNLALHVGDNPHSVLENRRRMLDELGEEVRGAWLNQVHGCIAHNASECLGTSAPDGDAVWTDSARIACLVMTADCLPVLLSDAGGRQVAAVHAGWRGLAAGVVEAALQTFTCRREEVLAWLGPAISRKHFDVGSDVYEAFVEADGSSAIDRFTPIPDRPGFFYADLAGLAEDRLRCLGVTSVGHERRCSYADAEHFFSYRREKTTGRNAAAIVRY